MAAHLIFFPALGQVFAEPEAPLLLRLCTVIPGFCPTVSLLYSGRERCKRYMEGYDSLLKLKDRVKLVQQQYKTDTCAWKDCQLSAAIEWFLEKGGCDEMHTALLDELFGYTDEKEVEV